MKKINLINHIAIIMDGNGRWAEKQNFPRRKGHEMGAKNAYKIVEHALKIKLKYLTLFAFSTENWARPDEEVSFLMKLLLNQMKAKANDLNENGIKLNILGDISRFSKEIQKEIKHCIKLTSGNSKMTLSIALNYGARQEIVNATKQIAELVQENKLKVSEINEKIFSNNLFTNDLPDPDLLIRTSGEKRISNFLLWQISYCELFFSEKFWPEYTPSELDEAINEFNHRVRKYGKI